MHFPVNIGIGQTTIPIHLVCETLSFVLGYRYYSYLRGKVHDTISDENRLMIFIGAAAGAFLGSHLVGVLESPAIWQHLNIITIMGNKTIVGGFLGGLAGVEICKKYIGEKSSSGDLMVYPIILAMIIGRTGCFLAGLEDGTYGIPSKLPWAIDMGDGIPRHPTNLYEILFWLLLSIVIYITEKKYKLANGARFKILMVSYLIFRFLVEFIKPDYFFPVGLGTIQLVCLGGIAYYYKVFLYPQKLTENHA